MRTKKSLWWAPTPWERDGGAIVGYYLWQMMNYLEPMHELHIIPKVPEELDASDIAFAHVYPIRTKGLGEIPPEISSLMSKEQIPLLTMFHIPWEFFPVVRDIHDIGGKILLHQTIHWDNDVLFQSPYLQEIDHWVTPTEFAKNTLASVAKIPSERMTTIPHGVNLEKYYPHKTAIRQNLGIKDDDIVILWVGRCQLTKGAQVIIPIIRKLLDAYPNVWFVARAGVFQGVDKSKEMGYIFDRLAARLSRLIFIPNWCEPSYMEELTAMCDILLCPSGHEGFSLPPIEAMACGKPVALSAIANHLEIVNYENYKYGVLMEPTVDAEIVNRYPSNPDGTMVKVPKSDLIYGTLQWMIENRDECKIMGENGLKRVREVYNLAKIADQWLNLIDELNPEDETMEDRIQKRMLIT